MKKWISRTVMVLIAILVIFVVSQVDNWDRDLFINYAGHTVYVENNRNECVAATLKAIKDLDNWERIDCCGLHAVRTSRLGFKDDVYIYITGLDKSTEIRVWSKSRIGIGDLGQNPRNIVQLLKKIGSNLDLQRSKNVTVGD